MQDIPSPRPTAEAWAPQLPGRRGPRDIVDAIVEPDWGGARVVAALTEDEAALYARGVEIPVPEDLLRALLDSFQAIAAVVEGHLTTTALQSSVGVFPPSPKIDRMPLLIPRVFRNAKDDPYVHARDYLAEARAAEPETYAEMEAGEPHAFVATDLLWLDGDSLLDVPLLERKRLLEGVLEVSHLVRVTAFVRTSSALTLGSWGAQGFRELSYRAANSHYLAGRENPEWAVGRAPDGPTGPLIAAPPR